MNASIDKEDSSDGGGSREVLASWLDAHAAGECDTPKMQAGFLGVCRRNHEAPWDALALLDQYQRRGKLDPEVARTLKSEIAQMVFGTPTEAGSHTRESAQPQGSDASWHSPGSSTAPPQEEEEDSDDEEEEPQPQAESARFVSKAALRGADPPAHIAPLRSEPRVNVPPTRRPVRTLRSRYELQEVLGRGSDGVVYRALDRNRHQLLEPQRYVAVKVLSDDPPLTAEALIEYQRGAHHAQSLVHPHMVRVLDFDHDGDLHFLVMELLQGQPLEVLLEREGKRGLVSDRALKIIADVGAALAYAHEHGVILGNLTPRKIIVTSGGDAKLIDVGFPSRGAFPGQTDVPGQQYAQRYASAERVSGEPLTTSDDVYALACIAYELLAHRHPYDERSGAAARMNQLRPKPIAAIPRQGWLALERALRWTRAERDLTASQLSTALTNNGSGIEPEFAIRAPRRDTGQKPRSRAVAWMAAIMLLAIAGAGTWWLLPSSERAEVRDRIDAVQRAAVEKAAPKPPSPPVSATDTARTLEGGQLIPTQPAGSATGPSALEAITNTPESSATAPAPSLTPDQSAEAFPAPSTQDAGIAGNGVIGFPKDTYVVRESDVVVRIPVVRTRGTRGEVSFRWRIERNSAEPGNDFGAVGPATEYMAAGQSSTVLHIPLVSDNEREGTEMFLVHIDVVGSAARSGELTRAAVIVVDDD